MTYVGWMADLLTNMSGVRVAGPTVKGKGKGRVLAAALLT